MCIRNPLKKEHSVTQRFGISVVELRQRVTLVSVRWGPSFNPLTPNDL
jgi:hypothetical protein